MLSKIKEMQFENQELEHYTKDVIGFDLGHGDTSISHVSASGGDTEKLEIVKGYKVIPTAFSMDKNGVVVIGKDAYRKNFLNVQHQFKNYKVNDSIVAKPLGQFLKAVIEKLHANNSVISFDRTTLIVFGVPSTWSNNQCLLYKKFLASQIPNTQAMFVPESRAAFITMKDKGFLKDEEIQSAILIVDLGSLTTDFTFVYALEATEIPISNDCPLGASYIEQKLVEMALSKSSYRDAIESWWKKAPSEYNRTVWEFRKAKEDYYKDESGFNDDYPINVIVAYYIKEDEKVILDVDLRSADFKAATDMFQNKLSTSWRSRLLSDLETTKKYIYERTGHFPHIVILTGGAARMDFVEESAKEIFPDPTIVRRAPEPEHAISTGLALAGSIQYRTQSFLREVDLIIASKAVEDIIHKHMGFFAESIANAMATGVMERFIIPEFLNWRRNGKGKLKDIAVNIANKMEMWQRSKEGHLEILKSLSSWYEKLGKELHNITAPLCSKYRLRAETLDLPKINFDHFSPNNPIEPDEIMLGSSRTVVNVLLATISIVLGTILFGSGTAILVSTNPIFALLAGLILFLLSKDHFQEARQKLMEKAMDADFPKWIRKLYSEDRLRKKLSKKTTEVEEKIRSEIIYNLVDCSDDIEKKDEVKQNQDKIIEKIAAGIESALKQRAKDASILLV